MIVMGVEVDECVEGVVYVGCGVEVGEGIGFEFVFV